MWLCACEKGRRIGERDRESQSVRLKERKIRQCRQDMELTPLPNHSLPPHHPFFRNPGVIHKKKPTSTQPCLFQDRRLESIRSGAEKQIKHTKRCSQQIIHSQKTCFSRQCWRELLKYKPTYLSEHYSDYSFEAALIYRTLHH